MSSEKIEFLAWDSDFFNKKIGRVFIENSDNFTTVLKESRKADYQLIYAFGRKDFFVDDNVLKQFNGHLADRKVLYEKKIETIKDEEPFVSEYKNNELIPELEELAYISGEYSRFKLDKNFDENDFYRMYKVWMENSIKHLLADNVFIATENNRIKGMVTLKIDKGKGHIGLIAVSPDMQGKGYGKALIAACENELWRKGACMLEVPTQTGNIQACKFYEKCGFQIKDITNVYHFWL